MVSVWQDVVNLCSPHSICNLMHCWCLWDIDGQFNLAPHEFKWTSSWSWPSRHYCLHIRCGTHSSFCNFILISKRQQQQQTVQWITWATSTRSGCEFSQQQSPPPPHKRGTPASSVATIRFETVTRFVMDCMASYLISGLWSSRFGWWVARWGSKRTSHRYRQTLMFHTRTRQKQNQPKDFHLSHTEGQGSGKWCVYKIGPTCIMGHMCNSVYKTLLFIEWNELSHKEEWETRAVESALYETLLLWRSEQLVRCPGRFLGIIGWCP